MTARILVVDDIEANRRLLEAKLSIEYFEVVLASNGQEALDTLRTEDIDIILLDVMMPGLDGYEVCERIKADPRTAMIPVVMVTALGDRDHRVRGLKAGAEDFLTKPIDDFALLSRVRALMRYSRVVDELSEREANGLENGLISSDLEELQDKPVRVFIADDNVRTAEQTRRMLQNLHDPVCLHDAEGDSHVPDKPFEIVLVPLSSRKFDALRLCASLLNNDATRSCSIIVIAEHHERARAVKALDLGASDVISAPLDVEELLVRVRTQARRSRYIELLRRRVDLGFELAVIDPLTNLHNRRYMVSVLTKWLRRIEQAKDEALSVVMIDLDRFKRINDCFGHKAGDDILRELADRIRMFTRPSDIPCRYGGEEFVVVMPHTDREHAEIVAERLREAIEREPFKLPDGETVRLTASFGVAEERNGQSLPGDLIDRADKALYRAKSAGRNAVVVGDEPARQRPHGDQRDAS